MIKKNNIELKRILLSLFGMIIFLTIGYGVFLQYQIENYLNQVNLKEYKISVNQKRKTYSSYFLYDLRCLLSERFKESENDFIECFFRQKGFPKNFNNSKDRYLFHSYFTLNQKDSIRQKCIAIKQN